MDINDRRLELFIHQIKNIENNRKLITNGMINRYIDNELNPESRSDKVRKRKQIQTRLKAKLDPAGLATAKDGLKVLDIHEKLVDSILPYAEDEKEDRRKYILLGMTIILLITMVSVGKKTHSTDKNSASYTSKRSSIDNDSIAAWVETKSFVRERLKSPSSADFPFLDFHVKSMGDDQYMVGSYVDSTNGFGAKVRTRFRGIVKKTSTGWELVALKFYK
jgi:hypothetical protein